MCGIAALFSHQPVANELLHSILHLQHRGQDAAGILTYDHEFHLKMGQGLVKDIFSPHVVNHMPGNIGIAHTRYPTAGENRPEDVQPVWINAPIKMGLAHNGNLVNTEELIALLPASSLPLKTTMDSEVLLKLLASFLAKHELCDDSQQSFFQTLCHAVHTIFTLVKGSYSVVALIEGKGLVVFRDPFGFRPLVMGSRIDSEGRKDILFASENAMFYSLQFKQEQDVKNGEVVFIDLKGKVIRKVLTTLPLSPCMFEYVYFARPDAMLDKLSVYRSRIKLGQSLAKRWQQTYPDLMPDIVIPVPHTSNISATSMARTLKVKYSEGLYKNPYIGRTFIMSDQENRSQQVRLKLSAEPSEIRNKKVLLVDDSIVRGTTCREIIKMVRGHGAREVYLASCCPPIKQPCFYGIDIPKRSELLASNKNVEEIKEYLGLDALLYQTEESLIKALQKNRIKTPCMACINGQYLNGTMSCFNFSEKTKVNNIFPLEEAR